MVDEKCIGGFGGCASDGVDELGWLSGVGDDSARTIRVTSAGSSESPATRTPLRSMVTTGVDGRVRRQAQIVSAGLAAENAD
ncbi:hypothetical protein KBY55_19925 [Streptomyces sp. b94]|nr:hypothetical protein [Streptomyces sp. b94]MBQ1098292.1 hypothetical protein [Streptomyces sp. b94]